MTFDLILLLLPLVVGYLIPGLGKPIERSLERASNALIYIILLLMGASITDFGIDIADAGTLLMKVGVFAVIALLLNMLALRWVERRHLVASDSPARAGGAAINALKGAITPLVAVVAGVVVALLLPALGALSHHGISLALYLMLLLVGHQLRASGISLRQIVLNTTGVKLAAAVIVASLIAALISAPLIGIPLTSSLALASGFGWYSLSAVMLNDQISPIVGAMALCNDLFREVVAIMMLPMLSRRHPGTAIGYCGGTAMDMTLPIISRYAGVAHVPTALSCGALLSLAAPLLMALFASMT
ncbi:Lysine exporter LysO [Carnimonas sp. R-84981]|uniref:lysine exporter LysO family protein n=1 Tax=Carnimonas bestiolae TaxID=3402172 RepID=UPI003EDBF03E